MIDEKVIVSPIRGYIKSIEETDTDIIIPVIGIPFGDEKSRDLHNEYFDKFTDIGVLNEVMVYFNHNRFYPADDSPEELEKAMILARAFKGNILGIAKKAETTEEGVIYNIILDKRKRYSQALRQMIEDNLLDVSSGAKYRELDPNNQGRISKWHTVEISLTPSPANPNAVPLTKSILERALEETKMPEETKQELGGVEKPPVENANPNPTDELMKSLQSVLEKQAEVPVDDSRNELLEKIVTLESQVIALQAQVQELTELVKSLHTALPYMATQIVNRIDGQKSMSSFEKSLATTAPKPAPTLNKRPVFDGKGGSIMKAPGR